MYSITGESSTKKLSTHDQTFTLLAEIEFVNDLVDISQYPPMIFGHCIRRLIHQAISLRFHFPEYRILCVKWDFKAAYRRIHYHWTSASMCVVYLDGHMWMSLRLSFGGKVNPPIRCSVSETITDIANDLMNDPEFDPDSFYHPVFEKIIPLVFLSPDIPLATVKPTMVLPPPRPHGFSDMFIDDRAGIVLDKDDNVFRALSAALIAIESVSRAINPDKAVQRQGFIEEEKISDRWCTKRNTTCVRLESQLPNTHRLSPSRKARCMVKRHPTTYGTEENFPASAGNDNRPTLACCLQYSISPILPWTFLQEAVRLWYKLSLPFHFGCRQKISDFMACLPGKISTGPLNEPPHRTSAHQHYRFRCLSIAVLMLRVILILFLRTK